MTPADQGDRRVAHLDEASAAIPAGEGQPRFAELLRHGSMSVELYAPQGRDLQEPHAQDELYIVATGSAALRIGETIEPLAAGSVAFVRAGEDHRFEEFSADFSTWVVFWGPPGGEAAQKQSREEPSEEPSEEPQRRDQ
ncbi:MAG: cupin domain-containing protein [Nocardioides sp.]